MKNVHLHQLLNKRVIALLLILIQSCGIRFFNGQGSVLTIIVLLLSVQGFPKYRRKDIVVLICTAFFFLFNKIANPEFSVSNLLFQFGLVFQTYTFLLTYNDRSQLKQDLKLVLKIVFIHSLAGYLLFLLVPFLFQETFLQLRYKTLFHLFYVSSTAGQSRNTGICWEPGILQLPLNIYLFICIRDKSNWKEMMLIVLCVVSTFSTTGFIILALNATYYVYITFKKRSAVIPILVIVCLFAVAPFAFIKDNISDKLGGQNTSGLVRYRDYLIGVKLIEEKPILGHGYFDTKYLRSKPYVGKIEGSVFSQSYLNSSGELSGGYTNGLLGLLCWYGVPVGILCYYLSFRNKIIDENIVGRTIFFLILMLTFLSEPLTYTSFFLLFPFSAFLLNRKMKKRIVVLQHH